MQWGGKKSCKQEMNVNVFSVIDITHNVLKHLKINYFYQQEKEKKKHQGICTIHV